MTSTNVTYVKYLDIYEHLPGQFIYIFIYRKQMLSEQKRDTIFFLLEL